MKDIIEFAKHDSWTFLWTVFWIGFFIYLTISSIAGAFKK